MHPVGTLLGDDAFGDHICNYFIRQRFGLLGLPFERFFQDRKSLDTGSNGASKAFFEAWNFRDLSKQESPDLIENTNNFIITP